MRRQGRIKVGGIKRKREWENEGDGIKARERNGENIAITKEE